MGKPVITYIRNDLKQKYSDFHVVSGNPLTIENTLYDLFIDPKPHYDLGVKGRKYAEEHHLHEKIARQLITV